jgi:bacterioferritin-associated ferredoxin
MNSSDIVCRCNLINVGMVQEFKEAFPKMPNDQLVKAMNVGSRCGCCNYKECPNIDLHISKVFEQYDKT